jgi:peptide/nickel transport system permease protein/oligopeptide transport system permease protein
MRNRKDTVLRYIGRRLLLAIPTLFGVATVVFFLIRLIPGDPAQVIAGEQATPQQVAHIREILGLNLPVWEQYLRFLGNLLHGSMGTSTVTGDPVLVDVGQHLPNTLELTVVALAIGIVVGVTLGLIAAANQGKPIDVIVSTISVAGMSVPTYWLGLNLIVLFAVQLHWFPPSGNDTPSSIVLPAVTLATLSIAVIARMTRSSLLEVLSQDFVRTARAKGASPLRVILRHALPNAIPPILTVIGVQFGLMLGGAVLTESVFTWPGMGSLLINSISARDFPVVQGCVLLFSVGFIIVNIAVDLLYSVVDPRIIINTRPLRKRAVRLPARVPA